MSANVETMFYVRDVPWHGLGVRVEHALSSYEALEAAELDWSVEQQLLTTENGDYVKGHILNVRDFDQAQLGLVTSAYKVVQNSEAFAFTDTLIGEGVRYETAGSLNGGKKVWLLARLPQKYNFCGDKVESYLVFSNSHDGKSSIRVAITPIRVVCQNTLNMALKGAQRIWSVSHKGNLSEKLEVARETLQMANGYMTELGCEVERLSKIKLSETTVISLINLLLPVPEKKQRKLTLNESLRKDLKIRYFDAPDVQHLGHTAFRFMNAVSDTTTHASVGRRGSLHPAKLFDSVITGNPLIDKAYELVKQV